MKCQICQKNQTECSYLPCEMCGGDFQLNHDARDSNSEDKWVNMGGWSFDCEGWQMTNFLNKESQE